MKTRKRTSAFWTLPENDFIELIKNSRRWKDVFDFFRMTNKGGNFVTLKERVDLLGLDFSHFLSRTDSSGAARALNKDEFKTKCLIENCETARNVIKKYLIRFNLIPYKCEKCSNSGLWENELLSLHLEHKNGVSNDNRIENICFLCPNCHSQTDTYSGKNKDKKPHADSNRDVLSQSQRS